MNIITNGSIITTLTGFTLEVKDVKKDVLTCYVLNDNLTRIKEKKINGEYDFKMAVITRGSIKEVLQTTQGKLF